MPGIFLSAIGGWPECPHRRPADLKPARDLGFGNAGAVPFADLVGVPSRRDGAAQLLAVHPCLCQTGTGAFAQDLAFELGEDLAEVCIVL
jgi:hypothetical protein